MDLDLYEKVYSPDDVHDEEYSWIEWDSEKSKNKYYKKVPILVTDEECEELKKYSSIEAKNKKGNTIATLLMVIAWIVYILGFILGIVLASESFALMLVYWVVTFIGGTFYLAFAEIIKLLVEIKNK